MKKQYIMPDLMSIQVFVQDILTDSLIRENGDACDREVIWKNPG